MGADRSVGCADGIDVDGTKVGVEVRGGERLLGEDVLLVVGEGTGAAVKGPNNFSKLG